MKIDQQVADNLMAARKTLSISQKAAADSLGVKLTTYGAWERGVNAIPVSYLVMFCTIHNISLSQIIPEYGTNETTNEQSKATLMFDQLLKSGANPQIISHLKDHFLALLEELSIERQKVIEEKEKLENLVQKIEKQFKVKIDRS